ncbi:MAG: c-type cytochrome domain-containing protein, partial [Saprospiraceae bacterium]
MKLRIIFILYFIRIGLSIQSQVLPDLPEEINTEYKKLPDGIGYNLFVKPILSDKCFACHGNDGNKRKAGLRLDLASAAYGPLPQNPTKVAIRPGELKQSEIYHRIISDDPYYLMPDPESHLTLNAKEKAILIKWIAEGGVYQPH